MSADSASGGKRQLQSIRLNLCQWLGLKMLEICLKIIWVESHQTIIILSKYGFSLKVSKDSEEFISNLIQFGHLESFLHLSLNHAACVDVWWRVQGEYLVWPRKALTPSVWTMLGGFYCNIFSIHPLKWYSEKSQKPKGYSMKTQETPVCPGNSWNGCSQY